MTCTSQRGSPRELIERFGRQDMEEVFLDMARGRGRGMGLNFSNNQIAVAWDQGAWGLVYRLDELRGAGNGSTES